MIMIKFTNENLPVGSGKSGYWFGASLPKPFSLSSASFLGKISIDISANPYALWDPSEISGSTNETQKRSVTLSLIFFCITTLFLS